MSFRFEVLDSFRGLCALCVLFYHLNISGSISEISFFNSSSIFVQFFFVLSGFVLTHSYYEKKVKFNFFFLGRVFRILPLHIAMLLMMIIFQLLKLIVETYGFHFSEGAFSGNNHVVEILPNLLLLQSWLPFTNAHSFNYPAWSISIEFYVYIFFFITLFFFNRYPTRLSIWLIASVITLTLLAYDLSPFYVRILTGVSCFFMGTLTYLFFYKNKIDVKSKLLATMLELCLLIIVYYVVCTSFSGRNIIASLLFTVVIFYFAHQSGYISYLLKHRLFIKLGALSYSIYLTHMVVLNYSGALVKFGSKVFQKNWLYRELGVNYIDFGSVYLNNLYVSFLVVSVIIFSLITHKYIELYWQKNLKQKFLK